MKVRYSYENDILMFTLLDEALDVYSATGLLATLTSLIEKNSTVVINLGKLREMDHHGIGVLTKLARVNGISFSNLKQSLKEQLDHSIGCQIYFCTEDALSQAPKSLRQNAEAFVCSLLIKSRIWDT